jgi:hypothetical protein
MINKRKQLTRLLEMHIPILCSLNISRHIILIMVTSILGKPVASISRVEDAYTMEPLITDTAGEFQLCPL